MDLKRAVALVTGGNGGLGRRICHALAEAGAQVGVVYHESREASQDVVEILRGVGVEADAFQCDVTDPRQVESLVSQVVGRFGRVDILVNDAAYNRWIPFSDLDALTSEEWTKIIGVNLTGPMLCIKAVAGPMKRQGAGRVVNIASVAGLVPTGSSIPYGVSKAGLVHLTKCMAVALAPEVLVNCVAPGYMEGTRSSSNLGPDYRERSTQGALLKRPTDKDDVAAQVVAFCRTDSITGQTLLIDAGRAFH